MKNFLLALLLSVLSVRSLLAQVPPPPDNQENAGPGAPSGPLPVDQYVFILIGLAIVGGIYLILNKRKAFN